jgi:hypothetical protein
MVPFSVNRAIGQHQPSISSFMGPLLTNVRFHSAIPRDLHEIPRIWDRKGFMYPFVNKNRKTWRQLAIPLLASSWSPAPTALAK